MNQFVLFRAVQLERVECFVNCIKAIYILQTSYVSQLCQNYEHTMNNRQEGFRSITILGIRSLLESRTECRFSKLIKFCILVVGEGGVFQDHAGSTLFHRSRRNRSHC